MRIAGPDVVLFAVGLLLFSGASYGIYMQGGLEALREETSALGRFAVDFDTARVEVGEEDVANMRSGSATFEVNASNVARAFVTVTCTDGQASTVGAFTLQIRVAGPNGTTAEETGGCGQPIEIPIDVTPVPSSTTVAAHTETEARNAIKPDANATRAQGTWTVTITGARSAGPLPVPEQVPAPSGSIALAVEQWTPDFTAEQGR